MYLSVRVCICACVCMGACSPFLFQVQSESGVAERFRLLAVVHTDHLLCMKQGKLPFFLSVVQAEAESVVETYSLGNRNKSQQILKARIWKF